MTSDKVIQYMKRLPGVAGVFIVNPSGQVMMAEVPPIFEPSMLSAMATDGINALETLRAELPSCHELRIDTALMTVLIKEMQGSLLFVLVDQVSEVASVRIALNVVNKRYSPGEEPTPTPTATEPDDETPPLGGIFSTRSSRAKGETTSKKPKPGKGIWG